MNMQTPQFDYSPGTPSGTETKTTLLIASTPRSGSHMLANSLGRTGVVGTGYEYCNPGNLGEWKRVLGIADDREALRETMRRRTAPNGVFSLKIHFMHCALLGGPKAVFDFFPNPKVVFIRRPDLLRQAISYSIAQQTKMWIGGERRAAEEPIYDAARIARCMGSIAVQNADWTSAFAANGITPLHVDFDRVTSDLPAEIARILDFLGLPYAPGDLPESPPTRAQGVAARTEDWIRRFERDSRRAMRGRMTPEQLVSGVARRLKSLVTAGVVSPVRTEAPPARRDSRGKAA